MKRAREWESGQESWRGREREREREWRERETAWEERERERESSWEEERRAVALREKEEWESVLAVAVREKEESQSVRWESLREGLREREMAWGRERLRMSLAVSQLESALEVCTHTHLYIYTYLYAAHCWERELQLEEQNLGNVFVYLFYLFIIVKYTALPGARAGVGGAEAQHGAGCDSWPSVCAGSCQKKKSISS
jgi:hypothetical protein